MGALYFMFIFFVFMVAYGVARHVILNPDEIRALITPVKEQWFHIFSYLENSSLIFQKRLVIHSRKYSSKYFFDSEGNNAFVLLVKTP